MNTADKATEARVQPATKEELFKLLEEDEYVIGALITIYGFQTDDEQLAGTTKYHNDWGFNGADANWMSSISRFYLRTGFLTPAQMNSIRKAVKKYHRQLISAGVPFKKIKTRDSKPEIPAKMWAGMSGGGKEILAKFQFPRGDRRFNETLAVVKTLPGRRWNPDLKAWTIAISIEAYETLRDYGFELGDSLKKWYEKITAIVKDTDFTIPGLNLDLYPFQKEGISFINSKKGRVLIGDEMGLGKTAQALAWLQLNKEVALPALAVVPAGVKIHWERKTQEWTEIPVTVLSGRNKNGTTSIRTELAGRKSLTIINYDILDSWMETLKRSGFKSLIIDECHYTKNAKALRTKAVKKLAAKVKYVMALSGTPIINRPAEFVNALLMLRSDLFTYHGFMNKYCEPTFNPYATEALKKKEEARARREKRAPKKTPAIYDYKGASNTKELHNLLTKTIMIRRTKDEVLKELPPKVRTVIPLEFNHQEYDRVEEEFSNWLERDEAIDLFLDGYDEETITQRKRNPGEALVKIEKLKQAAAKGKIEAALAWIEDYLDTTGKKLVVFATHHKVIDQIVSHFKKKVGTVKFDGRDSQKQKQNAVDAFQTLSDIRLFVGNIKAAGIGITLHAADATCFVELGWTPGEHDQAEDRVHRIGQESDSVSAYYLVAERTVEEEIAKLLDKKREVLEMVLNGKEVEEESLLMELLRKYKKEEKENG